MKQLHKRFISVLALSKTQRIGIYLLTWILFLNLGWTETSAEVQWPAGPDVKAESAILMDADTGAILYEKDIHTQHYPASITKIMTTLLALENSSLQDTVTFSYNSINKTEGSRVGYMDGEQITMEQCLYSVMLSSANEGAYAVAEHIGGTVEAFVNMMNERAQALGCTETHFSNPHGLPDETHVTSAHDMALIAKEAYKNENFRAMTKTVNYTVPPTNKYAEARPLYNHHRMLKAGTFHYDYCTGGKTGYTNAARNTLVTYAEKNGMTLISVIMKDDISENQYLDTIALLDYGFNNFKKLHVTEHDLGLQLNSDGFFPINHNPLSKDTGKITLASQTQLVIPNLADVSDITTSISFTSNTTGEIALVNCNLGEHFLGDVPIIYTPGKNSPKVVNTTPQVKDNKNMQKEASKPFPVKTVLLVLFILFCIAGFIAVIIYAIRNGLFERN